MKKTILLGTKGAISVTVSKWTFGILGLFWLVLGIIKLSGQDGTTFESIGHLIIGSIFLLYSVIVFTLNPFAPKVVISDDVILIKPKLFNKPIKVLSSSIKSIEFGQYKIMFHLEDSIEEINYSSNAKTSIEIKSAIRIVAEHKNIPISGG